LGTQKDLELRFSSGAIVRIIDAHRDGKRFVLRRHEKLTAFLALEADS
jgi:hypothetical protein